MFPKHRTGAKWGVSSSSDLPEPKLPEKQKAPLGQFLTQSRIEMETKVLLRETGKLPLPFSSKDSPPQSWGNQERGREQTAPAPPHPQGVFFQ